MVMGTGTVDIVVFIAPSCEAVTQSNAIQRVVLADFVNSGTRVPLIQGL